MSSHPAPDTAGPQSAGIETPSGKGAGDENFPVGSFLLPAHLRPHVARYYAFARAIDDIADNPGLAAGDKVARLDLMAAAVLGEAGDDPASATAERLRASLAETGVSARRATDLTIAFKQDATKLRYRDWADLMGYCENSANPVGRYLLDLHGEDPAGYPASDALCSALQVINHLQDCADDYRVLDRVYLPQDWLAEAGVTLAALDAPEASPGLRRVLDRCLDATEQLMAEARRLPGQLKSRSLAMESAVIVRLAEKLIRALRRRDPLAERVVLSKPQVAACALSGVAGVFWRRLIGRRGALAPARTA
jgi:squalene synthase HpnC